MRRYLELPLSHLWLNDLLTPRDCALPSIDSAVEVTLGRKSSTKSPLLGCPGINGKCVEADLDSCDIGMGVDKTGQAGKHRDKMAPTCIMPEQRQWQHGEGP